MPRYSKSLPPADWPEDVRARFEALDLSVDDSKRLGQALGRWLLITPDASEPDLGTLGDLFKPEPVEMRKSIRRVLALVFSDAAQALHKGGTPYAGKTRKYADARQKLVAEVERALPRMPMDWRERARPLLFVDPDEIADGVLIQAWSASTVAKGLQRAGPYFDHCRHKGMAPALTAPGIRSYLDAYQEKGNRIGGASIAIESLLSLARALFPEKDWRWLSKTSDRLKKIAVHAPSRNAGRAAPIQELRDFGFALFGEAEADFDAARNWRQFLKAHTKARTALTIIVLSEAPARIGSVASIALDRNLLASYAAIRIDAEDTKTGEAETRIFSAKCLACLGAFVRRHRAVVDSGESNALFLGDHGRHVDGAVLSRCIGDVTEERFGRRVTPHAFRHAAGNFIVAEAPEEAALASVILAHKSARVTPTYTKRADQVLAGRKLQASTSSLAEALGVKGGPSPAKRKRQVRHRKPRAV